MIESEQKANYYTLGLDIGIASVGAALLGKDRIIALHVRTFSKAETDKKGESLNKIRREARLLRRRLHKRSRRLIELSNLMMVTGLIDKSFVSLIKEGLFVKVNVWQTRSEGLDRVLSPIEWAASLYHIIKHRGFQSNRKSELKSDAELGKMLSGIKANQALIGNNNYRTVGELVFKDGRFSQAKRNKHGSYTHTFNRDELNKELMLLFKSQREFQNQYADIEFEQKVIKLLMKRKPPLSGDALLAQVGTCTFESGEKRCPKASIYAERFIWLGKLNNLTINNDGLERKLTKEEHDLVSELPFLTSPKVTYTSLRKKLNLKSNECFNGIHSMDDELQIFFEAKGFHQLRKCYKASGLKDLWLRDSKDFNRLHNLAYALTCYKIDDEIREWLINQGVEENIIQAILSISFEKFIQLSVVAVKKILPHMENKLRYDEAISRIPEYGHHSQFISAIKRKYLPKFDPQEIRNPVVYRALNQARKLLNAIVKRYGSPAEIHIELARNLSQPFKERKRIEREQKDFHKKKESLKLELEERFGIDQVNSLNVLKLRLYKEQDRICAYSLDSIDWERLCEPGYVEIDHIIPYSRSFDDSINNKALVLTRENRNKGNQTPYEYLGGAYNSDRWSRFYDWVKSSHFGSAKQRRLLLRDLSEEVVEKFKERNLSDTRYICRVFKNHIESYLRYGHKENKRCIVVSGQLTAYLRAHWGLVKQRENGDLHHALDAAVVAATSQGMVKRISDYSKRRLLGKLSQASWGEYVDPETGSIVDEAMFKALQTREHFPQPWLGFREELLARLSDNPRDQLQGYASYSSELLSTIHPIRVSRMPTRRGTGAAHKEKIRSTGKDDILIKQKMSSRRVELKNLKLKDLENILGYNDPRNKGLILAIKERLEQYGNDGERAFSEDNPFYKPGSNLAVAPRVRTVKLLKTQKNGVLVRGGIAENANMLRIDIFKKKGNFYAVPLYVSDCCFETLPNRAAVQYKLKEDWELMDESAQFLFSLHRNDWVKVTNKKRIIEGYFVSFDISSASITLRVHDRNNLVRKDGEIRGIGIKYVIKIEKYHVDVLGAIYEAKNETRNIIATKKLNHQHQPAKKNSHELA